MAPTIFTTGTSPTVSAITVTFAPDPAILLTAGLFGAAALAAFIVVAGHTALALLFTHRKS